MSSSGDGGDPGYSAPTRVVVARRSWAIPAILLVALGVVLVGFLGQKQVPPRPSAEPTPSHPPVSLRWTEVPVDASTFGGASVGLVINGPRGVLALGQDQTDRHPIAWTSPDARSWTRHDELQGTFGGGVPDAAAEIATGFIAIGYHATANGTTRDVWTSPDGVAWTRDPSPTGRGFDEVISLVGAGRTAVLVAYVAGHQLLLSSQDGRVWAETPDLDATLGRNPNISGATDSGVGFLAVGSVGSEGAIWRSSNGHDWARVTPADPSVFAGASLDQAFRTRTGLLVTGYSGGTGGVAAWASYDGIAWSSNTVPDATQRRLLAMRALGGADLGISGSRRNGDVAAVRISVDAKSWFDVAPPTTEPLDWVRQAAVVDGAVVMLAHNAGSRSTGAWLGTVVAEGTAGTAPAPSGSTPSQPASTPLPSPSSSASGPPTLPPPPLEWRAMTSRDVLQASRRDLSMSGIVALGQGLLAFGAEGNDAAFWWASDARHWQRLPISPSMRGAFVHAVTASARGLIAVGYVVSLDQSQRPAAWTSADGGRSWVPAKGPAGQLQGDLDDVIAGPGGIFAVGWGEGGQGSQALIWTSPDGSVWAPVASFPRDPASSAINAIVAARTGFVAVGRAQGTGPSMVGAAWTSPDGRTWTEVKDLSAFGPSDFSGNRGDAGLTDIVAGGPGFVAVGTVNDPDRQVGAIFTSTDGLGWTRLAPDPTRDGVFLGTVTTWAGGLAAVGNVAGNGPTRSSIWTSRDGVAWTPADDVDLAVGRADDGPGVSVGGLVRSGSGLVGVGSAFPYPDPMMAVVWIGASPGVVVPDHLCPARIDTLAALVALTGSDRVGCIGDHPVTVAALVRASTNDCGIVDGPPELTGCGAYLDLAPIEGGPPIASLPIDPSLVATFGGDTFSPWMLTLRTDIVGPQCEPAAAANGVVYDPPDGAHLQCRAVLRLVAQKRIVRR